MCYREKCLISDNLYWKHSSSEKCLLSDNLYWKHSSPWRKQSGSDKDYVFVKSLYPPKRAGPWSLGSWGPWGLSVCLSSKYLWLTLVIARCVSSLTIRVDMSFLVNLLYKVINKKLSKNHLFLWKLGCFLHNPFETFTKRLLHIVQMNLHPTPYCINKVKILYRILKALKHWSFISSSGTRTIHI